jgi:tetratricopeptide (TPR) repeat protein
MTILRLRLAAVILLCALSAAQAYTREEYRAEELAMDRLFTVGDFAGAEAAARALLVHAQELFGSDSQEALATEAAIANSLSYQGKGGAALEIYQSLYARAEKALGEYHPFTLRSGIALAVKYSQVGRTKEGLPYAIRSVKAAEVIVGEDDPTTALWRYTLAGLYADLGYLEEALAVYRKSLATMAGQTDERGRRDRAVMQRQIARTEDKLGDRQAALADYELALPMFRDAFGPEHPETATTMGEYVLQRWRAGQRDDLLPVVREAQALAATAYGAESLAVARTLEVEALVVSQGGPGTPGFDEGLALMRRSVAMKTAQVGPRAEDTGKSRLDLAAMLADAGTPDTLREALIEMKGAEDAGYNSRNFFYGTWIQAAEAGAVTPRAAMEGMLDLAQRSQGTAAASAAQKLATRLAMGDSPAAAAYRRAGDLLEHEYTLQQALMTAGSRPAAERDTGAELALRDELAATRAEIEARIAEVDEAFPSLSDLNGDGVLSLDQVQAMLAPDEALLIVDTSAAEGDRHFTLAVSRDDFAWAELNWTADSFTGAVADVRKGIGLKLGTRAAAALEGEEAPPPEFDVWAADWLYHETLFPVERVFRDKPHLYFDLRGPLAGLPPQLLVASLPPEDGDWRKADWLVRHHAVTVLPSVFSLKTVALARGRAPAPEPLLAFADPVFDLDGGSALVASLDGAAAGVLRGALSPLPETGSEVRAAAETLGAPAAALRTGAAASEAALKETRLSDFRVLYFATHGLVTGDVAGGAVLDQPALALTPGRGEDGFLTVSEIIGLDLRADWVVLSACNTAVGNDPDAEALSGLAQAFFYAGARALMVSHWPVESRSAAHLMTETFRLRAADPGQRAAEAQRRAMLEMIDDPAGRWAHPAYWAPFVLVGSPD